VLRPSFRYPFFQSSRCSAGSRGSTMSLPSTSPPTNRFSEPIFTPSQLSTPTQATLSTTGSTPSNQTLSFPTLGSPS